MCTKKGSRSGAYVHKYTLLLLLLSEWNPTFVFGQTTSRYLHPEDKKVRTAYTPEKDALAEGREAGLKRNNEFRAQHGAPPLILDDVLNERAQKWAEEMAETGFFGHDASRYSDMGQNCFTGSGTVSPGMEVRVLNSSMNAYYREVCKYAGGTYEDSTGHFTALVWARTTKLGLGIALSYNNNTGIGKDGQIHGTVYAVANYNPFGNGPGDSDFQVNVIRPLDPQMVWKQQNCKSNDTAKYWFGLEPYPIIPPIDITVLTAAREAALKGHNDLRAQHGLPPFTLDDKLNEQAQTLADFRVRIAPGGKIYNHTGYPGTEKIVYADKNMVVRELGTQDYIDTALSAIKVWYHQICDYRVDKPFAGRTSSFRQVMSAGVERVGFGFSWEFKENMVQQRITFAAIYPSPTFTGKNVEYTKVVKHALNPDAVWKEQNCSQKADGRYFLRQEPYPITTTPAPPVRLLKRPDSLSLTAVREAALKRHNELRAQHGLPPTTLDAKLNEQGQLWAEDRILPGAGGYNKTNYIGTGTGDLIYGGPLIPVEFGTAECVSAVLTAINNWYHEVCAFQVGKGYDGKTSSFSQVVWASVETVGFGLAMGYDSNKDKGKITFVAIYQRSAFTAEKAAFVKNVKPVVNPDQVWKEQNCSKNASGRYYLHQEPYPITTTTTLAPVVKLIKRLDSPSLVAGREAALKRHNELRAQHGLPPIALDDKLNEQGQLRAEDRILPGRGGYNRTNYKGTAEIFFYEGGPLIPVEFGAAECIDTGLKAINIWYHEVCDYVEGRSWNENQGTQRFGQVVWASVETVGFGLAMGYDSDKVKGKISFVAIYQRSAVTAEKSAYVKNVKPLVNPDQVWKEQNCTETNKGTAYLHHG